MFSILLSTSTHRGFSKRWNIDSLCGDFDSISAVILHVCTTVQTTFDVDRSCTSTWIKFKPKILTPMNKLMNIALYQVPLVYKMSECVWFTSISHYLKIIYVVCFQVSMFPMSNVPAFCPTMKSLSL